MGPLTSLDAVDERFDRFAAAIPVPGLAYGVVADGELVHVRGLGTRIAGRDEPPDADTAFRIASMTKSFTASAVLLLRDEGRLRLDDPAATWVPELAGQAPTADSPAITIRHLLTMTAGFPTDDPWGDRQQPLDPDRFAALLRGGLSFAWAPGARFEYSNLGYAVLGRVVAAASGRTYRGFVEERLLAPLGMTATGYLLDGVPADRLALGYVWRDGAWLPEPIDGDGAFAPMGGLFTTVMDLTRWVAGFIDAYPARDDPEGAHPVRRASRREMQSIQVVFDPEAEDAPVDGPPGAETSGYGFGLFASVEPRIGTVVGHGGGYPGYGSTMAWHPASGIGVIALANARYAQVRVPAREALRILVAGNAARVRTVAAWPATLAARAAVERLLARWDDGAADALFAMNVDLDEPLDRRRAEVERLRGVHGRLAPDPDAAALSESPAHLRWWMRGDRGSVRVEILLDPEHPQRVQALTLTSVPEPPAGLRDVAARVAAALADPCPSVPAELVLDAGVDGALLERSLRVAAARFGPAAVGRVIAGDGVATATFELPAERGMLVLELRVRPADSVVEDATLRSRAAPAAPFA